MDVHKTELERLKLAAQYVVNNAVWEQHKDTITNHIAIRMLSEVLQEKLVGDTYEVKYETPRSPWQMWKLQHGARWLLWWKPIQWKTHTVKVRFTRYALYPGASIAFPKELGRPVIWEKVE